VVLAAIEGFCELRRGPGVCRPYAGGASLFLFIFLYCLLFFSAHLASRLQDGGKRVECRTNEGSRTRRDRRRFQRVVKKPLCGLARVVIGRMGKPTIGLNLSKFEPKSTTVLIRGLSGRWSSLKAGATTLVELAGLSTGEDGAGHILKKGVARSRLEPLLSRIRGSSQTLTTSPI
jgi:hypothetical protein